MHFVYLSVLSNIILEKYFLDTRCVFIFSDTNLINYKIPIPVINVLVSNTTFENLVVFKNYGCQGFVINVDSPVTIFNNLEQSIKLSLERFNSRRYLFIPTQNEKEDVMDVFDTPVIDYVSDIVVVKMHQEIETAWFTNDCFSYKLYSHKFVGVNSSREVLLLDQWWPNTTSFLDGNDLYPDKLGNGYGRTLRIATFSYKPYSVPALNDGIELQLGFDFCRHHNLTPFLVLDEEGEWGEVFSNWSGYGILGNLATDAADIGLGALYTWESAYVYLDLTKPLIRTGITCLVPAPRLAGGWLVPMFSFTYDMWMAVGLSFILCSLGLFATDLYISKIISHKRSNSTDNTSMNILSDSLLISAAIFLLQGVSDVNLKISKKLLYACMFLFSLLIASSYSSGLASSMTVPRYIGAIRTVEDLIESGIQWGATSIAWLISISDAKEEKYLILLERFVKTDEERLTRSNDQRFAFSIERLSSGYFAIGDYITEEGVPNLRLMTEDIYWEHCVLMTRKSSIWTPILDDYILRLAQTGIPSLWEYKVATTHLNANVQRAVKFSSHHSEGDNQPIKLRWEHVEGTFALWIIGIILSSLTFFFEIFRNKVVKTNKNH